MPPVKDAPEEEDAVPRMLSSHVSVAQLHPVKNTELSPFC